jgi:hypothetical protein
MLYSHRSDTFGKVWEHHEGDDLGSPCSFPRIPNIEIFARDEERNAQRRPDCRLL